MKPITLLLLLFCSIHLIAQNDTIWYFGINGRVADTSRFEIQKNISFPSKNKVAIETFKYGQDKKTSSEVYQKTDENTYQVTIKEGKKFTATFTRRYSPTQDGLYEFIDIVDEKVKRSGVSKTKFPLFFEGTVVEYYLNGKKMSESVYKNNEMLSNKNWEEEGAEWFDNVFYSVDKLPFFKSGNGTLHQHILTTIKNSQVDIAKVSGNMVVGFIVFENGSIGGYKILKGVNSQLNGVVVQALMTLGGEWVPAQLNGKQVRYFQLFPVNFISENSDMDYLEFDGNTIHWDR